MSVNKKDLIEEIEKIAPKELMESWDNTGVQVLCGREDVDKLLICLDICDDIINEAIENGCSFIVSHHPMLFTPIKSIDENAVPGRYIIKLIFNGISVYSSHTSFDTANGGNNDYLAALIGLTDIIAPENEPIMRIGTLKQAIKLGELCQKVSREIMNGEGLSYSGNLDSDVKTVGICTGAGTSLMDSASAMGCDVLITGDMKYHDSQRAQELGINVIDAGHFETEIFFIDNMKAQLKRKFGDRVEVLCAKSQKNSLKRFYCMI